MIYGFTNIDYMFFQAVKIYNDFCKIPILIYKYQYKIYGFTNGK